MLYLKAFHVIGMVAWMAGMLYLPRLFVYHVEAGAGTPQAATFKVMERRLLRVIMTPAMIAVWITGLALLGWDYAHDGTFYREGWLHAKLLLVLLMSGGHGFLAATTRRLAADDIRRPARFYRFINEVPTVLMIGIVILVIVKPF